MNERKKVGLVLTGFAISSGLLAVFLVLNEHHPEAMDLGAYWVALALVPAFVYALWSGAITIEKFSAFGIEATLKSSLNEVQDVLVVTIDNISNFAIDQTYPKGPVDLLLRTGRRRLQRYRFLRFAFDRSYSERDILAFINKMPNLRFFEIVDREGRFRGYLPLDAIAFETPKYDDPDAYQETLKNERITLKEFIAFLNPNLRDSASEDKFARMLVTSHINTANSLADLLRVFVADKPRVVALVDSRKNYVGPILPEQILALLGDKIR